VLFRSIRSRCQLIRFQPIPPEIVADLIVSDGLTEDRAEAQRLAAASGGSVQRARELADPDLWTARTALYEQLSEPRLDSVGLAAQMLAFVDRAGAETAGRRERLRQVAIFAAEYFAALAGRLAGSHPAGDADVNPWAEKALASWHGDAETAALCAERCLEAAQQVDRNAHPATLLECWLDDLARASTRAAGGR
jgi:DNA polymerase-3 subunit delta'